MKIKFITDSNAYLDEEYTSDNDITVMTRSIKVDDDIYLESGLDWDGFLQCAGRGLRNTRYIVMHNKSNIMKNLKKSYK